MVRGTYGARSLSHRFLSIFDLRGMRRAFEDARAWEAYLEQMAIGGEYGKGCRNDKTRVEDARSMGYEPRSYDLDMLKVGM